MKAYPYDLHVHSCLSPCADNDMTPKNIAGMASLNGLRILALTDHNSARNCPAFLEACREFGICGIPGMELTTAEEIHLLCLFPDLESALDFDAYVTAHRSLFPNDPSIFGDQIVLDAEEREVERLGWVLPFATDLSVEDAIGRVRARGGFVCPAHIDKKSNGMVEILGTVPNAYAFSFVECHAEPDGDFIRLHGLEHTKFLFDSDAHYLWDISEGTRCLHLDTDEPTIGDVLSYLLS